MRRPPHPMLATAGVLPSGPQWAFEVKWDGVRALAVLGAGRTRLYARSGTDITVAYPELAGLAEEWAERGVDAAVLDGELVCLDGQGHPSFSALAQRLHVREAGRVAALAAATPVTYMIFDVLEANGSDIRAVPYGQRREWLESVAAGGGQQWLVPPRFTDGALTWQAAAELDLEGVVAKRLMSVYRPGVRSPDWIKVKHELTGDYVVGGWRRGQRRLGALLVGAAGADGRLSYRGRVGGGLSVAVERELLALLEPLAVSESPFDAPLPADDARGAHYVEPRVVVEVRYGQLTPDRRLRFPRFVRLRPDKSPQETVDE